MLRKAADTVADTAKLSSRIIGAVKVCRAGARVPPPQEADVAAEASEALKYQLLLLLLC